MLADNTAPLRGGPRDHRAVLFFPVFVNDCIECQKAEESHPNHTKEVAA